MKELRCLSLNTGSSTASSRAWGRYRTNPSFCSCSLEGVDASSGELYRQPMQGWWAGNTWPMVAVIHIMLEEGLFTSQENGHWSQTDGLRIQPPLLPSPGASLALQALGPSLVKWGNQKYLLHGAIGQM